MNQRKIVPLNTFKSKCRVLRNKGQEENHSDNTYWYCILLFCGLTNSTTSAFIGFCQKICHIQY